MVWVSIAITLPCAACGVPLAINGIAPEVKCDSCGRAIAIGVERWRALLVDVVRDATTMVAHEQRVSPHEAPEGLFRRVLRTEEPSCPRCGLPLAPHVPPTLTAPAWAACGACGTPCLARRLDAIVPDALCVLAEDPTQAFPSYQQTSVEPVAIACPQCGGPLRVDGSSRMVPCSYCRASVQLPDTVWQRLHPKRPVRPFYLLLKEGVSAAAASIPFDTVKEITVDDQGNLYLYGDVALGETEDGYDKQVFAVWSLDRELRPRWKREIPGEEDYYLAVVPGGTLVVWHREQVLALRCDDGRDAPEATRAMLRRALGRFGESYGCVSIDTFPDGALLLVGSMGNLVRVSSAGDEQPLLPARKGFLGRLVPAVEGHDKGPSKLAVCTKDGGLIVLHASERGEKHDVVGYGPDGNQRWKLSFEGDLWLDGARMTAAPDGRALVYTNFHHVLWVGPSGAEWVQRDDDSLRFVGVYAVAPDGAVWNFGDEGAIRKLSAGGEVLWANKEALRRERES